MKTHLFYFSSTGNGLMIARRLAEELGETEIFSIPVASWSASVINIFSSASLKAFVLILSALTTPMICPPILRGTHSSARVLFTRSM